jgi:hypothetical protein
MPALTTAILALSAASTVGKFLGDQKSASIAKQQGNAEGAQFDINASLARSQAADATARGEQAASGVERSARALTGAQRAALAAQGIDPNSGSAAGVVSSDRALSVIDEKTIRNNAARAAWGFNTEAEGYSMQARWARQSGKNQAGAYKMAGYSTLLGGAADLASIYQHAPKGVSK